MEACRRLWNTFDIQQQRTIYTTIREKQAAGRFVNENPYYAIYDNAYPPRQQQQPSEPTDWNGRALEKGVQYITAKYNGRWGLYSKEDVELFGLEVKN